MVIQSKKVWLADQFVPAAIEVNDGRITAILPYGTCLLYTSPSPRDTR